MLQAEYLRDMHNNYLVLKGEEGSVSGYEVKMLLNNTIEGLLKLELRCIDQMDLFYYDITSLKSVSSIYEIKSLNYNEIKNILGNILITIDRSREFLLSQNDFIIDPDYIYVDGTSQGVDLCHLVGYRVNIQEQLSKFIEYLMNKVDYKDEDAVLMIYAMYKESREVDCTFEKLLLELNKKVGNKSLIKQNNTEKEEKTNSIKVNEIKIDSDKGYSLERKGLERKGLERKGIEREGLEREGLERKRLEREGLERNSPKRNSSRRDRGIRDSIGWNNTKKDSINRNGAERNNTKRENTNWWYSKKNNQNSSTKKDYPKKENIIDKKNYPIKEKNNINEKQILEEVESQREILYFDRKTYILAGIYILGGLTMFSVAIQQKLLHNSFGTHLDMVKVLCCILMVCSAEVFLLSRLFDKKKRVTRMETNIEYVDQYKEEVHSLDKNRDSSHSIIYNQEEQTEETQVLWLNEDEEQEKTMILAQFFPQKQYYLVPSNSKENIEIHVNQYPFVIGKALTEVNLTIEDVSVSRYHAKFINEGEDIYLIDLSSTNGTYINGNRLLENKLNRLSINDEIRFSNLKYLWKEK